MRRTTRYCDDPDLQRFARDAASLIRREVGTNPPMLESRVRFGQVVQARHVLAFFLREHSFARGVATRIAINRGTTRLPFTAIAGFLGGLDHTSVIFAVRKIAGWLGDRRFENDRALVRRVALDLQSLGYGPSDLSTFFWAEASGRAATARPQAPAAKPPISAEGLSANSGAAFLSTAGRSVESQAVPQPAGEGRQSMNAGEGRQTKGVGDPKREAVSAGGIRHPARSYKPAKHGVSGVSVSGEERRA